MEAFIPAQLEIESIHWLQYQSYSLPPYDPHPADVVGHAHWAKSHRPIPYPEGCIVMSHKNGPESRDFTGHDALDRAGMGYLSTHRCFKIHCPMSDIQDPFSVRVTSGTLVTCDSAAKQILLHVDGARDGSMKFIIRDVDETHVLVKSQFIEEIKDLLQSEKNTYVQDDDM